MKYLLVVIDGGADLGRQTPYQMSRKPNIDSLAAGGKVGLFDPGYEKDVNSDVGYLKLLSCYSKNEYPGRGYIEALGVNLVPGKNDLCMRANFATLDSRGNVADRRAGRDETGLDEMAGKLDGMQIDGVTFTVIKSTGHRLVIMASGKGLSRRIRPNDPMKTGVPLPQVSARDGSGKFTASVLNRFLYKANAILSKDPANRKRKLPANAILVRNAGMRMDVKPFEERFGLRATCIAGVNVARGVARFLGMDAPEVKGATGRPDTDLKEKRKAVLKAFRKHDFVFLHVNGTDIFAHDRDRMGKTRMIEAIDKELGNVLEHMNLEETCVVVTSDHTTVSLPREEWKKYEHTKDPVPIVISGDGIKPDPVQKFDEEVARKGSLKLSDSELVPFLLMITSKKGQFA